MLKNILIFITASFLFACSSKRIKVDSIFTNAKIYTVDSVWSIGTAMAIDKGKILDVNSEENILENYISDSIVDIGGKTIIPGMIDAHCHFTGYATDLWKCNLVGTKSWEEILSKLTEYNKTKPMKWLYARGWDQNDWDVKEFPDNKKLDELFPNEPVYLKRIDGHAALANSKALEMAGITVKTKIEGGEIEIKNGKLTGILIDNAMQLVERIIPEISDSLAKVYFEKTQAICFANGLTGVHDCGVSNRTIELLKKCYDDKKLKMKIFALMSDDSLNYDVWLKQGIYKDDNLHVGGFKLYADGALGSRGACLLHNYSDKKKWNGFLLHNQNHFKEVAEKLAQSNFQMCTHAIGDSANRLILKTYAHVLKGKNNKRWRIEHAQIVNENDFNFFGEYDIIPSVQPTHATSDMYWAEARLGKERIKTSYAYKQLLEQNKMIALGTDFPVEEISPIKTFYAAVARKDKNNFPGNGFQKENALSREQALRGMTIWAAYSAFEESEKGSLEKNKAADFVILSNDIMKCSEAEILKINVEATYVDGKSVFGK